jgi:hypothetical protein
MLDIRRREFMTLLGSGLLAGYLVGSKESQIRTDIVACTHLGLFLGSSTLLHTWSKIARWLAAC